MIQPLFSLQSRADLVHHGESGAALDLVADVLVLDHNAALGGVAGASAAVDEEAGAAAHAVGCVGVQVVAVVHSLEGAHVAQSVASLGKRTNAHLALAGRVVAARARSACFNNKQRILDSFP